MFNKKRWVEEGNKARVRTCILCGNSHTAFNRISHSLLCPDCSTPQLQKEDRRVRNQNQRAKSLNLEASLTFLDWIKIVEHFNWRCAYCPFGELEVMEHLTSLTLGGGTERLNVVPACRGCNSLKDRNVYSPIKPERIQEVRKELFLLFTA